MLEPASHFAPCLAEGEGNIWYFQVNLDNEMQLSYSYGSKSAHSVSGEANLKKKNMFNNIEKVQSLTMY